MRRLATPPPRLPAESWSQGGSRDVPAAATRDTDLQHVQHTQCTAPLTGSVTHNTDVITGSVTPSWVSDNTTVCQAAQL